MSVLLDPAFNGSDLALCILAVVVAHLGSKFDKKRNRS